MCWVLHRAPPDLLPWTGFHRLVLPLHPPLLRPPLLPLPLKARWPRRHHKLHSAVPLQAGGGKKNVNHTADVCSSEVLRSTVFVLLQKRHQLWPVCFFFSPSSDSVVSVLFLEVNRSVDATVIPVLSTSCGTKRDKSMSWTPVVSIWNLKEGRKKEKKTRETLSYKRKRKPGKAGNVNF